MHDYPEKNLDKKIVEVALALIVRVHNIDTEQDPANRPTPIPERASLEFLITQRLAGSAYAGWWEFPGGKIEPGESPEDAVIRETWEELRVQIRLIHKMPTFIHDYEHASVRLHPFLGILTPSNQIPSPIEVADLVWCRLERFPREYFLPGNADLVRSLKQRQRELEQLVSREFGRGST